MAFFVTGIIIFKVKKADFDSVENPLLSETKAIVTFSNGRI